MKTKDSSSDNSTEKRIDLESLDITDLFKDQPMLRTVGEVRYSTDWNMQTQIGATWEGNWHKDGDISIFGNEDKQRHWAAVREQPSSPLIPLCFSPITTKKQSPGSCIVIPPRVIKRNEIRESYLLYRIKLRISKERLKERFRFYCMLPDRIVSEFKKRISQERDPKK